MMDEWANTHNENTARRVYDINTTNEYVKLKYQIKQYINAKLNNDMNEDNKQDSNNNNNNNNKLKRTCNLSWMSTMLTLLHQLKVSNLNFFSSNIFFL